jgi:hypothetical protein
MTVSLDIIIVNWNTQGALAACLQSIEAVPHETIDLMRVVVIDNNSSDDSLSTIGSPNLPIYIQRNTSNLGFAAGCNQGAQESRAEYLLFLNPDTRLTKEALQRPLYFKSEPQNNVIGICGIRLLDDHGLPGMCSARFPTPGSMWTQGTGLHRLAPRLFADRYQSDVKADVKEVDQVIGAYFLIRRHLFDQLNGFDERFFVYFEEVDISLRARNAGYGSCILGSVSAYHTGCVSSDQVKDKRLFYFWRSRLLYARKHFSGPAYCGVLILTFVAEPINRILQATLSGSIDAVLVTVRAYAYLIRHSLPRTRHGYAK